MPIIEVNHVTKEYKLGQLHSLKTTALNQWRRLTGQPVEERAPFKALDDVNFSIEAGEVVGIIGHNGAGKSTMLKLLANISKPSSGSVTVKGKVAPLIEVGAGLVGDLTGRENVYLNGAILGIPKAEIQRKFDDIVAFAELEEFIDTPIKRYSSGMQVRLGFSIATSVESDILIVDEVLAVGDLAFQRKCFDRMEDLIKRQGKTVLLVSHNIRQVERLCSRVILLGNGRLQMDGEVNKTTSAYFDAIDEKIQSNTATQHAQDVLEEDVNISVMICDDNGQPVTTIDYQGNLNVVARIECTRPLIDPIIAIGVHTIDMLYLTASRSDSIFGGNTFAPGVHHIECRINSFPLTPGVYSIRMSVVDGIISNECFYGEKLATFTVRTGDFERSVYHGECFITLPSHWALQAQEMGCAVQEQTYSATLGQQRGHLLTTAITGANPVIAPNRQREDHE